MKILHVIKTLSLGGAESNLFNVLRFADGDDHYVAYSCGGDFEERFLGLAGVKFIKYARRSHKVKSLASIAIILKLAAFIRENGIEIVHTHNYNGHVWGALAAKLTGAKIVEHVHDFRFEEAEYLAERHVNPGQFSTAAFFARFSDRIIVLTENNRRFLLKRGVRDEKISVLPNGIPLDVPLMNKDEIRARLAIPAGKKVALFAARLSAEKNAGTVLRVAEKIGREDVLFLIAGSGPQKDALESGLPAAVRGRVRFLGFYPRVAELLAVADIFIQPTLLELHSITMLEAMGSGVPALVSRGVGCNDDFIESGKNGFLLDPNEPAEWADMITRLLDDRGLSVSVAAEGRRLVESRCDIKETVKKIQNIYRETGGVR